MGTYVKDHSAIGKRGQARRRVLGLAVADVAARLGCKPMRVYQLECYGVASITMIARWASALEMDPAELAFGGYETPEERAERRRRDDGILMRRLGA